MNTTIKTQTDWVRRAGRQQFKRKADAVLQAIRSEWVRDSEEENFNSIMAGLAKAVLLESINQAQNGQGVISAADLHVICEFLGQSTNEND